MRNDQQRQQIESVFDTWHLRYMDARDAYDIKSILRKFGRYDVGERAIQDELRPQIQRIYRSIQACHLQEDYELRKEQLIQLCRTDIDGGGELSKKEIRWRRAPLVVELMLACTPYLDSTRPRELSTVAEAIVHIEMNMAGPDSTIRQDLHDFLNSPRSSAKTSGQIAAIIALATVFTDGRTVEQLEKIIRDRNSYEAAVQGYALVGLCKVAASNPSLRTDTLCQALSSFIADAAHWPTLDLTAMLHDDVATVLPALGDLMLDMLIDQLLKTRMSRTKESEQRRERFVLTQAICLFQEKALDALLSTYVHNFHGIDARPLIMALKELVASNPQLWWKPVRLTQEQQEITLFQAMMDTIQDDAPGADLAVQALRREAPSQPYLRQLLWNKVSSDKVTSRTRSQCLMSLVASGQADMRAVMVLCSDWIISNDALLEATATLVLAARGPRAKREHMQQNFVQLLLDRSDEARRLCRASPNWVRPMLERMLETPEYCEAAVKISVEMGRAGLDMLAGINDETDGPNERLIILRAFRQLPRKELARYRRVIDRAYKGSLAEQELAEEMDRSLNSFD